MSSAPARGGASGASPSSRRSASGCPPSLAARDDELGLVGPADVAGVDANGGDAGLDRLQRERGVEVNVGDDRERAQVDELLERLRVLVLRDGDPDDLAAGRGELADLRHRRVDVVRLRERHRLDGDGCTAADRHVSDANLPLAGHRSQCIPAHARSRGRRLPRCKRGGSAAAPQRRIGRRATRFDSGADWDQPLGYPDCP